MYLFRNEFRALRAEDGYEGVLKLPTGGDPIIHQVSKGDESVDIILSGTGCNETMIILATEGNEYILVVPKFNMVAIAVADSMVDYLRAVHIGEKLSQTAWDLICDYDMLAILDK